MLFFFLKKKEVDFVEVNELVKVIQKVLVPQTNNKMPKITVHLRLQKLFRLIQIIHQHLYLLLESSKKMSAVVHPTKFFEYFDNLVDTGKAFQLYSVSVSRSIHHITEQIKGHSNNYKCYCFLC